MKTVLVPLADGFEEIEAITIIDVLRRGGVEVTTAALRDKQAVHGAHGIVMAADHSLDNVLNNHWDAIVLPGGGQGMENMRQCDALRERLREQKEEGGLLCAICAAPLVLEAAHVIDEEHVTCYPTCADEMEREVQQVPVIADGQLITGSGPGTAMLFALAVLRHLTYVDDVNAGTEEPTVHKVAREMLAEF